MKRWDVSQHRISCGHSNCEICVALYSCIENPKFVANRFVASGPYFTYLLTIANQLLECFSLTFDALPLIFALCSDFPVFIDAEFFKIPYNIICSSLSWSTWMPSTSGLSFVDLLDRSVFRCVCNTFCPCYSSGRNVTSNEQLFCQLSHFCFCSLSSLSTKRVTSWSTFVF